MMRRRLLCFILGVLAVAAARAEGGCAPALDFAKRPLAGSEPVRLCEVYRGQVVMIVNTASKCAFTPQYEALEALYAKYRDRGFVVLGFPSNDFGGQEPGTEAQIQEFCRSTYGVKFPMFEKTHAGRAQADPLFRKLGELAGEYPRWNFHKYLLDRDGNLAASFGSFTSPDSRKVVERIESLLGD
jgi:glutathione peroxidase